MNMDTIISKLKSQFFLFFILALLLTACDKNDPFDAGSGTFTDKRDGHVYKWVKIGEQIWMAENLAYVPYVCAPDSQCGIWVYDYYGEGSFYENYTTYGCLYDWETAQTACPEGWHLPSDEEWMEMERFLGMEEDELFKEYVFSRGEDANVGGKLKETGTFLWKEPNLGATNETGFGALPAGDSFGQYVDLHESACFWTISAINTENAYSRIFHYEYKGCFRYPWNKSNGLSIRCVKD